MDFHSMKRKELQALCKKHDIPANLTNLDMANKLTSLLKEGEKLLTQGGSCLKRRDEMVRANDSNVVTRQSKKSKLTLENEVIEFVNSGGRVSTTGSKLRPVAKKGDQAVENVDEFESSRENEDKSESSKKIVDKPVRVRRSRVQASVEGDLVTVPNPPVEKKRGRRAVKDVHTTTDKPPLPPPMLPPPPPPTVVGLSDNAANEEPGLQKRRSVRKRGVVEGGEVPFPNPSVEKKRVRRVAKDLNTSDKPPSSVIGLYNNAEAEETRLPKRRLLRNREVVDVENRSSPKPSNSVCKIRMPLRPLPINIGFDTPNLMAKSGVNHPVELKKEKSVVKDVDITNRSNDAAAEETKRPTRRLLRNKDVVEENKKGVENVDIVVSRKAIPNKRSAKGSDEVPKKEAIAATGEIIQLENTSRGLKRNEAKVEESDSLKEYLGKNENVKRQSVTRSRTQLAVKASAVDGETRTEYEAEVQRETEEILQLEETLQRKRRPNKQKFITSQAEKDDNIEEVDMEKSLKGYIRKGREYDRALHFPNRAGAIGSGNLMDSESQVGRARGGVVFWCNGSGCFALPKW